MSAGNIAAPAGSLPQTTLLLDQTAWDLVLDASGNIALASAPYALAQDAASGCRTFQGECWYDTTIGIPYLTEIMGQAPSIPLMKGWFTTMANRVPGIISSAAYIISIINRKVSGQIQVTDVSGVILPMAF
jgi:hypothetical protein